MRATLMYGAADVRVEEVPDPRLQEPTDTVVRVLRSAICGSDLWPYRSMPASEHGRRMGHEFLGVVEDLGAEVSGLKAGDLVVAPFVWADNTCDFCIEGLQTSCRHGGQWGHDLDGGQGEAVRVPQAQGTLVKLPVAEDSALLPSLLTLSDVFCTGHHAAATARVTPRTTVTVIGDGAVGLSAVLAAKQWIIDGYTLMFAALLLFAGSLSDRIGARRAFGVGLAVFVAASAACALAPTMGVLITARLAQGAAAAVMTPPSLALIREAYQDPAQRARAIGIWGLGGALASAVGPLVGGALSLLSWRLIFFVNLPVGLVALLLLGRVAPSPRRPVPFDWTGQVAALVAMTALVYGLIEGGDKGWAAPRVLAALILAVAAFAVFLAAQARGAHPMVPLGLFRSRPVVIALAVGFAFMGGYYGMVFLFSLYYQQQQGLTPLGTGLAFLPMTLLIALASLVAGRAAAKVGTKLPTVAGRAIMAAGLLALCLAASLGGPTLVFAVLMVPVGLGGAVAIPAITALLLDSVPAERAGTASGVLNTSRQVGGALAIAIYGALLANLGFLDGLRTSLLIAGLLLLATTLASLTLRPTPQH